MPTINEIFNVIYILSSKYLTICCFSILCSSIQIKPDKTVTRKKIKRRYLLSNETISGLS